MDPFNHWSTFGSDHVVPPPTANSSDPNDVKSLAEFRQMLKDIIGVNERALVPEHRVAELAFGLQALFSVTIPQEQPDYQNEESKFDIPSTASSSTQADTATAMQNRKKSRDDANKNIQLTVSTLDTVLDQPSKGHHKQKAVAKLIISVVKEVDGSGWVAKGTTRSNDGWRLHYVCADSKQNYDRAANRKAKHDLKTVEAGSPVTEEDKQFAESKKILPTYNCEGLLLIIFSASNRRIIVKYEHTPLHRPSTFRNEVNMESQQTSIVPTEQVNMDSQQTSTVPTQQANMKSQQTAIVPSQLYNQFGNDQQQAAMYYQPVPTMAPIANQFRGSGFGQLPSELPPVVSYEQPRERALRMLFDNGINPESLPPDVFACFQDQPANKQFETIMILRLNPQYLMPHGQPESSTPDSPWASSPFLAHPAQAYSPHQQDWNTMHYYSSGQNMHASQWIPQSSAFDMISPFANLPHLPVDPNLTTADNSKIPGVVEAPSGLSHAFQEGPNRKRARKGASQPARNDTTSEMKDAKPKLTRSRGGCLVCRRRRIKCDQNRPNCTHCARSGRECTWPEKKQTDLAINGEPSSTASVSTTMSPAKQESQFPTDYALSAASLTEQLKLPGDVSAHLIAASDNEVNLEDAKLLALLRDSMDDDLAEALK